MRLALPKFFLDWFAGEVNQAEEDRADVECIREARSQNETFRPLRDVLADIDAEEKRAELHRRVKQSG